MDKINSKNAVKTAILFFLVLVPGTSWAAGENLLKGIKLGDAVELHGAGGWAVGVTDGNAYLLEDPDGGLEDLELALILSARPLKKLSFVAQAAFDTTDAGTEAVVDYAFAEWTFSEYLQLRAGRAKHPFGIYGEVIRIGTLRPFIFLPQSIYGPAGMVAETYDGVTLSGRLTGGAWGVEYSLYGGDADIHIERPWLSLVDAELLHESEHRQVGGLAGVQLSFETPVSGLTFGFSGYVGDQEAGGGGRIPSGKHRVYGFHAEYFSQDWLIRGEVARHQHLAALELVGTYLEVARHLGERWQLALLYDYGEVDIDGFNVSRAPSLWRHEDVAMSLGRWFSPSLVVRAEVHRVDGNRFAAPEALTEALATTNLDTTTDLFQIGVQFSF